MTDYVYNDAVKQVTITTQEGQKSAVIQKVDLGTDNELGTDDDQLRYYSGTDDNDQPLIQTLDPMGRVVSIDSYNPVFNQDDDGNPLNGEDNRALSIASFQHAKTLYDYATPGQVTITSTDLGTNALIYKQVLSLGAVPACPYSRLH